MNRVDRQIIHCLQRDGRASFHRVGAVVGVSEQTVARRYRRLRAEGVLRVVVLPDARATAERTWLLRITCRPGAATVLAEALADRDDVSWVSTLGAGEQVLCVHRSAPFSPGPAQLLRRLPRTAQVTALDAAAMLHLHVGGDTEWSAFGDALTAEQLHLLTDGAGHAPVAPREDRPQATADAEPERPRPEDQPLLDELARDGRATGTELARATGWPPSRASSRLAALLGSGALHTELDLSPSVLGFDATAYLWLTVAPADLHTVGTRLAARSDTGFVAATTGTANLFCSVAGRDLENLYGFVTTALGKIPGVRSAEVVPVLQRVKQARARVRHDRLVVGPGATTGTARTGQGGRSAG